MKTQKAYIFVLFVICFLSTRGQDSIPMQVTINYETIDHASEYSEPHNSIRSSWPRLWADGIDPMPYTKHYCKKIHQKHGYSFQPLVGLGSSYETNNKSFGYFLFGGIETKIFYGKQWLAGGQIYYTQPSLPSFMQNRYDSLGVVPGEGPINLGNGRLGNNFFLRYTPSRFFNIEAGNGKNFLGDGYRSMLLSDQGADYPYIKLQTTLGPFRYVNLYMRLRNPISGSNGIEWTNKYAATHYLSWMLSKKINISLFETIIWRAEDSIRNRGIDAAYLNPLIFYRPLEFTQGSPDNVLMGLNASWNFSKKGKLYGQLVLDEFFIDEIRNGFKHLLHPSDSTIVHGAWVNKQAIQLGIKIWEPLGIKNINLWAEFNYARPYIYSHRTIEQNYSHQYQPLAHPYGANFREFLLGAKYIVSNYRICLRAGWHQTGLDSNGTHYGQNIFQSTFDAFSGNNIPVTYYGNTTAQGISYQRLWAELMINYSFVSKSPKSTFYYPISIFLSSMVNNISGIHEQQGLFIRIGLTWAIPEPYLDN